MSLDSMKRDLDNIQDNIRKMQDDVNRLTDRRESALRRVHTEYDSEIESINRRLQDARRREPDLARMVRKEEELERSRIEKERRAA